MWKQFTQGPLGIIALCLVIVYLIATVFSKSSLANFSTMQKNWLVAFLFIYPFFVLITFTFLLVFHSNKLYSPTEFKNEENFLKSIGIDSRQIEPLTDKDVVTIDGKSFKDQKIILDYTNYINCKFNNCRLIYNGEGPVGLVNCELYNITFSMDKGAKNALAFLHQIHKNMGVQGKIIVESTFDAIRTGNFPSVDLSKDE